MIRKPSLNEREVRSASIRELRVSTADDGSHTVTGYAVVFNSQSVDLGGFTEVIAPGALTRTLTENPDVLCLRDHKQELLLGRTTPGTLTLEQDNTGLRFSCQLPNTSSANDLAESLRRGDIDSCSFGFVCVNDTWTQDADGNAIRTILDLDLWEISIVSFPAYLSTSAALRSAPPEIRSAIAARTQEHSERAAKCLCPCAQCEGGDCGICSNPDCDDEVCSCGNAMERDAVRSWRHHGELRLKLHEHTL